uniref:Uncharacterized protein n=1 Tax=Arundo donax TaxID=35708 RepID=A0A0A9FXA0_ARUDO
MRFLDKITFCLIVFLCKHVCGKEWSR